MSAKPCDNYTCTNLERDKSGQGWCLYDIESLEFFGGCKVSQSPHEYFATYLLGDNKYCQSIRAYTFLEAKGKLLRDNPRARIIDISYA